MNVSEPHPVDSDYYRAPTHQLNSKDTKLNPTDPDQFGDMSADAYYDYGDPQAGEFIEDVPFDSVPGRPIADFPDYFPQDSKSGVAAPDTKLDWCTAFLQRLADPDRPHHATFNPYITVDWMPIDLTVFSGEDKVDEPDKYQFGFRSKNGSFDVLNDKRGRTFLSYFTDEPADSPSSTDPTLYFSKELPVEDFATARTNGQNKNDTTLGYLNSAFAFMTNPPPYFEDAPSVTPATLQWNNRDFASPYELMLVPMSSPGQLMQEFSAPVDVAKVNTHNHYVYVAQDEEKHVNIFTHLPNFFQEAREANLPAFGMRHAYTLATLLELVTVPSQWSDADKIVPPESFVYNTLADRITGTLLLGPLMPPYNRISQMREPGRVNINTLEDIEVMRGLEWSYLNSSNRNSGGASLAFKLLKDSRHAYTQPPGLDQIGGNAQLNPNYPTEFPGVFKSPLAAGRVVPTGDLDEAAMQTPAMASLLRMNPDPTGTGSFRPLFSPRPDLLLDSTNPQTEYLPFSRLANLTTTRSNVFAVRITIGYFEFDPATGVGPEYGWDNGQSRRHRGFYVIDRSIPVAYESGKDLNTGNCVLVRRIVE